jgi:hypothetical protein
VTRKILVLLAVAALAVAVAGSARADNAAPPATVTVQCADGTVWVLDPADMDVATFADAICDGDYVVLPPETAFGGDSGTTNAPDGGGGSIVADFSLSPNMAPDPAQYATEIQCPNGQVWAVASGDDFVCPAA